MVTLRARVNKLVEFERDWQLYAMEEDQMIRGQLYRDNNGKRGVAA